MIETITKTEIVALYIKELEKTPEGRKQLDNTTFIPISTLKSNLSEFHMVFSRLKKDERTNIKIWQLLTKQFPVFKEG